MPHKNRYQRGIEVFSEGEKIVIMLVFDGMADSGEARLATLAPANSSLEYAWNRNRQKQEIRKKTHSLCTRTLGFCP